jgi:predicted transporter
MQVLMNALIVIGILVLIIILGILTGCFIALSGLAVKAIVSKKGATS